MNWERERKIIKGLAKMYPVFSSGQGFYIKYDHYLANNYAQAAWVCNLCIRELNHRLPKLEDYIKEHSLYGWRRYVGHFFVKNEDDIF